jgi:mono/diheme cytochrome c family protein
LLLAFVEGSAQNPPKPAAAALPASPDVNAATRMVAATGSATGNFSQVKAVLDAYCIACHAGAKPAGEIVLAFADEAAAREKAEGDPEFWRDVARMVSTREMPPSKAKARPGDAERALLSNWVAGLSGDNGVPNPGRFVVHRLNNREYANTIRDLFYLPDSWDASADFPADERGDGFDNNSDTLTISPVLIEHYLDAAEKSINFALNIDNKGSKASQTRLQAPTQGFKEDFSDWQQKARMVVEVFLPRAYRRPVTPQEVDAVMKFAALAFTHDGESISRAEGLAMRAAIMSPQFLFRMERDPVDDGTGKVFQLDEFQLASRLSYFLWSSMPDDELFAAASGGKLRSDLDAQVARMLQSPRAISLTKDFMGQWLEIRGLDKTTNCPPELLAAMKGETEHYFNYIVHEDRSIMELLDSDYTFVNQTLAEHYGITGVTGGEFVKVQVDPNQRGGIFTQASFLTLTAKPLGTSRRTSPVNRGKWILENIFNEKIPPPPPNVPPLAVDDGKELKGTVRQILEQHRQNPDCITCHERMDPYGFALENYDGFGAWRTLDNHEPVDTTGAINGRKYSTPREFRTLLAARKDDFRRALVTKLLGYALARGVEDYDKPAIDQICAAVEKDGDRFSSLILNLVKSYPFQHARGSVARQQETKP